MKFRLNQSKHTRVPSVEIPIGSFDEEFVSFIDVSNSPTKLKPIVDVAWQGLKKGMAPELCEEGVGGTYFMKDDKQRKIAVFKPQDEEPFNVNNPKGYRPKLTVSNGFKEGVLAGEASTRECAAYWLDHDNFAGVPATDLVLCQHPAFNENEEDEIQFEFEEVVSGHKKVKLGSFQEFVDHDGDCEELSRKFVEKFPVDEVQKIAQLDIRIMNVDRHGGNILYKRNFRENSETYQLIPIDHGYALPSTLDEASFVWLDWPQVKQGMSPRLRDYISRLDIEADIAMLRNKFGDTIRHEHIRVIRMSTMLLKKGAALGVTLYDIARMVTREDIHKPCLLEEMCVEAQSATKDEDAFFEHIARLMDENIARCKMNR